MNWLQDLVLGAVPATSVVGLLIWLVRRYERRTAEVTDKFISHLEAGKEADVKRQLEERELHRGYITAIEKQGEALDGLKVAVEKVVYQQRASEIRVADIATHNASGAKR